MPATTARLYAGRHDAVKRIRLLVLFSTTKRERKSDGFWQFSKKQNLCSRSGRDGGGVSMDETYHHWQRPLPPPTPPTSEMLRNSDNDGVIRTSENLKAIRSDIDSARILVAILFVCTSHPTVCPPAVVLLCLLFGTNFISSSAFAPLDYCPDTSTKVNM